MYFNRETDYCIRIVNCLAVNEVRMGAVDISEQTDVSLRFALKILLKLVNAGLVNSFKGVKGGYELAKPAKDITLLNVIEAIDGPIGISQCLHKETQCERSDCCFFHKFFGELSDEIADKLKSVNFEDIKGQKIR